MAEQVLYDIDEAAGTASGNHPECGQSFAITWDPLNLPPTESGEHPRIIRLHTACGERILVTLPTPAP